jgi:hypothetical protein
VSLIAAIPEAGVIREASWKPIFVRVCQRVDGAAEQLICLVELAHAI